MTHSAVRNMHARSNDYSKLSRTRPNREKRVMRDQRGSAEVGQKELEGLGAEDAKRKREELQLDELKRKHSVLHLLGEKVRAVHVFALLVRQSDGYNCRRSPGTPQIRKTTKSMPFFAAP